jgi:hypothetical protein
MLNLIVFIECQEVVAKHEDAIVRMVIYLGDISKTGYLIGKNFPKLIFWPFSRKIWQQ